MRISKEDVEAAYQRNARSYDTAVKLFYPLIGLRIGKYRKRAVECLNLKAGDIVVDVGCGTGLCFPLLMEKIGPKGTLLGVDISSEMLSRAEERVKRAGWTNVKLFHSDIATFEFPNGINSAISIGVFGYIEERGEILERIFNVLVHNGRLVILDGKRPNRWPALLFKIFVRLSSPFGLTEDYFDSNTWEIVERVFENTTFEEAYGGLLYISSGEKTRPNSFVRI
jgi:demethylmenaquinone methyltransferase/2-methoxy-6-polyprenyl-1,4-benzoquinol methylase